MTQRTIAIIVAAGRGLRAGTGGPKQYREIGGRTVIARAIEPFSTHAEVVCVQPVCHPDDATAFATAVRGLNVLPPVPGGASRQASVRAGLQALETVAPDIVLIHDAARPFVSAALISRAISAVATSGAAIPAIGVADTIKQV